MTSRLLKFSNPTKTTWEIESFSTKNSNYTDFVLQTNNNVKFQLFCYSKYPSNLYHTDPCTWIKLYLYSCDKSSINLRYRISILNTNGDKCETREGRANFKTDSYGGEFQLTDAYLLDPKNGLVVNDKLTIYVEVEEIDENENEIEAQEANKGFPNNQIVQDFQSLLEEAKFSDASLIVAIGEKRLLVHKNILSARSKVFAAMFENDCEEKRKNRVEITDISAEVCEQMLSYIYTGKIPDLDKYAADLFVAADKYQLEHLKVVCEQYLSTKIDVESAANTLLVADMHHAELLKKKSMDFIVSNATKVMATEGWKALTKSRVELVIDLFQKLAIKTNH